MQNPKEHPLGYDPRWLLYGFLSEENLAQQYEAFTSTDDNNTEHYRYASFRRFLDGRSSLSDIDIIRYIELADIDPDQLMAGAALADLLVWHGLRFDQFEYLSTHPAYQRDFLQREVGREQLRRAISTGPISDELVAICLASEDHWIQRELVAVLDISREHLEMIAQDGCNRAVRNLAKQRLHDLP